VRRAALGAALGALIAGRLAAQTPPQPLDATIEAGAGSAAYGRLERTSVLTVAPELRLRTPSLLVAATGAFSRFDSGRDLVQGALAASYFTPSLGALRGELAATGQATRYTAGGGDASQFGAEGRIHLAGASSGVWGGGGIGRANAAIGRRPLASVAAGAWGRLTSDWLPGELLLRGAAVRTLWGAPRDPRPSRPMIPLVGADASLDPPDLAIAAPDLPARGAHDVLEAGVSWQVSRVELSAAGERRDGDGPDGFSWDAAGALWVTKWLAVAASAGRYLADPVQELAGGRYATLGVRVRVASIEDRERERREKIRRARMDAIAAAAGATFEMLESGGGERTIVVKAPGARSVVVMGDFTDWQPLVLLRAGDEWRVTLPIPAGAHRVNLSVNGGPWVVPPGLTPIPDEFVGSAGLLVVKNE
jgi:hypothetical protein